MKKLVLLVVLLGSANAVGAKPAFTGNNYSGEYQCKGSNDQVGDYEMVVRLKLNRISSHGTFGAYSYETETENSVVYAGQAAADGNRIAVSFNLTEAHGVEHSTGIATMKKNEVGRWTFKRLYYEGDDNGGIYGTETCVMKPLPVVKRPKKK